MRRTRSRKKSSPPNPSCHPDTIPIPCSLRAISVRLLVNVVLVHNILRKSTEWLAWLATQQLLQNFTDLTGAGRGAIQNDRCNHVVEQISCDSTPARRASYLDADWVND